MRVKVYRIEIELKEIGEKEYTALLEQRPEEDLLIISDSVPFCKVCRELNLPVVALLSEEGNTNQDFSFLQYALTSLENLDYSYLEKIWQRYKEIPWTICKTKRCMIRETTLADIECFYKIYREPSITAYMENLFENPEDEVQYTKDYIENVYKFYGFGMWTVCLKETGEVIGRAGLSMREEYEELELGYMIAVPYQGKGYALEVCQAILDYGKAELALDSVQILTEKENIASVKLAEKLGFRWDSEVELDNPVKGQKKKKSYERYLKTM